MNRKKQIQYWLNQQEEKMAEFLQKLIQEPSLRGREAGAQELIHKKCRELGMEIDRWEPGGGRLAEHPDFHCDRSDFTGSPNIAAILKGTGGGRSILLNGHIDVVPVGNLEDWDDDPFSGKIEAGRIYGRGASDMKGGTAAMLLAVEALQEAGIRLKGDIIFESVIEEESGGAGTLSAILRGYKADGAIIPEPTNLKIFPLQQGSMWFRIKVKGKLAHGGTRYEGVSAIELAGIVIEAVKQLEIERNQHLSHPLFQALPIPVPVNVGTISGGSWPSSVPDEVILEGRFGVSPFETLEEAKAALARCLSKLNETHDWFKRKPVEWEWFGAAWLPGKLPDEHPLLGLLVNNYTGIFDKQPEIEASPWGTDGGLLSGTGGIPTVVFGPGRTETAHEANEWIELTCIINAASILACTMIDWCGTEQAGS